MSAQYPLSFIALALVATALYLAVPRDAAELANLMPAAGEGDAVPLVPHKALYDFKMVSVAPGAGLTNVTGKMYYEQDDVCDAFTSDNRYTLIYHHPERRALETASHYVSWEAKDGSRFSFNSERQENGEVTEQLRGDVSRAAEGVTKAEYARPDDLSFELPAGYFLPMAHTQEIVRHARAGDKFFSSVLFDGTDAEGPVEVNVFIGKPATAAELAAIAAQNAKIDAALLPPEAWHVRMAIFPLLEKSDIPPVYEMDAVLHANGVVSVALVDYKAFKIEQKLGALEKIPLKDCP